MIQIFLLLQKVYRVYKINTPQCTDIGHHNHIFKVVKVILQRSVTFIVNSEGKSILLCIVVRWILILWGIILGEGVLCLGSTVMMHPKSVVGQALLYASPGLATLVPHQLVICVRESRLF
jgi:hypothetical protein